MSGSLIPNAKQQFLDANGNPLAGGFVYYYIPGTTTFKNTYQNAALTILNSNPIILDSAGECIAYGDSTYRQIVTDVNGNLIWDQPTVSIVTNVATNVIYTPPFTNSVAETVSAKLSESLSVKDFGAKGDGTTDDTVAIQNGITVCAASGAILFMPAGTYKVTDTITMPRGTQIRGEHSNTSANSFSTVPNGTVINFAPTTAKSLFVATGTYTGGFRRAYLIENLYIAGNSSNSSGNSVYAINAELVTDGLFRNIAIQYFRSGIYVKSTINNRFEYVRVINCFVECVLYDGGTATTDVWTQCYFSLAPIGINTTANSVSLGIRFNSCIFESLTNYGTNLTKESFNWSFVDCYAEDVPASGSPTFNGAMFNLGYIGTTLSTNPIAYIIGGYYGGSNNASLIGDGVRFGEISGAILVSPFFARYNYVLRGNTTTLNNSVTISGLNCIQSTGVSIDMTNKIQGFYANGLQNSGTLYQNANFGVLTATQQLNINILKTVSGSNISPFADVSYDFGRLDARWNSFYAKVGYVVTTPDGTKNYRIAVDNAGALTLTLL